MSRPPETSSLYCALRDGGLSRAHIERFASELAARHHQLLDANGSGDAALGYASSVGSILRHVFLHDGRMVLERPRNSGPAWEASAGAASDVAAVLLELDLFGKAELAHCFLACWLTHSGAFDVLEVLRAQIARAALVASEPFARVPDQRGGLRITTADLLAAARARQQPSAAPFLVITQGLSGAGKTTLVNTVLGATRALVVNNDAEAHRLRCAGLELGPGVVAERLEAQTVRCIRAGWPAIVESCFLGRDDRKRFRAVARALGVPFAILSCAAPLALIAERLERRRSFGSLLHGADADAAAVQRALEAQRQRTEPLEGSELAHTVVVDTSVALDVPRLTARLYDVLDGGTPVTWRSSTPEPPRRLPASGGR